MLFLMYWELNENIPAEERLAVSQKLTTSGLFPPRGVTVLRWDLTPDLWGIAVIEAENAREVFEAVNIWRVAKAGFFKTTKIAPALTVEEATPLLAELLKTVAKG